MLFRSRTSPAQGSRTLQLEEVAVNKSSLVSAVFGLALLVVIGGFASFAGNQSSTAPGTPTPAVGSSVPAPAVAAPAPDSGRLAGAADSATQEFSSDEKSPMVDPCVGVVCQTAADCETCCTAGGYDIWRCTHGPTNHHCICATQ